MIKISVVLVLILYACSSPKKDTANEIIGKWKAIAIYSMGKTMKESDRDSLLIAMFKERKADKLSYDGVFSAEDSINLAHDTNQLLNTIFGITYQLNKDKSFAMTITSEDSTDIRKGIYAFDPATSELTITLDSALVNKLTKTKVSLIDDHLELRYSDSVRYTFKRIEK